MLEYVMRNIKRNKKEFIFIAIMLLLCQTILTFTMQILCSMNYIAKENIHDKQAVSDIGNMKSLLQIAIIILVSLTLIIIKSNYSIHIQKRSKELRVLYHLGVDKNRINKMLLLEIIILEVITIILATLIGTLGGFIFMKIYLMTYYIKVIPVVCIELFLGTIVVMYILIKNTLKTIEISENDFVKQESYYTKDELQKKKKAFILYIVLILLAKINPFNIADHLFKNYSFIVRSSIYWTGILLGLNGGMYFLIRALSSISKKKKIISLYIAMEQNLFRLKKVNDIIVTVFVAVVLLVGLLGFYSSIRMSVKNNVRQTYDYDYLVIANDTNSYNVKDWRKELEKTKTQNQRYSIALIKKIILEQKKFVVIGVEDNICDICNTYELQPDKEIFNTYKSSQGMSIIVPVKKARDYDWSINEKLNCTIENNSDVQAYIQATYKASDLNCVYTSREKLSDIISENKKLCNSIYLKNYCKEEIQDIMEFCGVVDYSIESLDDLIHKSISQAVNGTELIETYIYIFLFYAALSIINLFATSSQERIEDYKMLLSCGARKKSLITSVFLESNIMFIMGVIFGWICGENFIEGALILMKQEIVIDTVKSIPYLMICVIIFLCFFVMNICLLLLSKGVMDRIVLQDEYRE